MDASVLYANPAFLQMCGRDAQSLRETPFPQLLTPGSSIFFETHFVPTLLLRSSLEEISLDLDGPGGQRVSVFANAVLRPADGNQPGHILIAIFPANQRRLYEAELLRARRESEQMEEVVRRSSDAILRISAGNQIESWNRGAQQIFGYSSEESISQPFSLLVSEESREDLNKAIAALKRGAEALVETTGRRKSGDTLFIAVSMTPHMEAPGILVGYSAIIRDITARKLAEKAVLQTEKLASVGRLASSIAHEINNPLEAVTNLLYILQDKVSDSDTKSLVTAAQEELARVSQIATHTLRFHKQSSGRTPVKMKSLFESVLGLYRARLQNAGIQSKIDSPTHAEFRCFEGELRQILVNLVANAFDAMRNGGKLTMRSRQTKLPHSLSAGIRITIADSGGGMSDDAMQHLFVPFFSTKGIGGTGLGLWITKDLVVKNHGTIRVRSSTKAGASGTVVTMTFPLQPPTK